MVKALADLDYQKNEAWDIGLQFADDVVPEGEAATKVTVTFRGKKTSDFTYDAATGLYSIRQYDRDLIDGTTGEQLAFKNLLVLYAEQTKRKGGSYMRSYYDLLGEGDGYFAVDGKIVKIKWSREEATDPFTYTLEDGTPITLAVGKTYLAVSATTSDPIKYE